jgi:signal transduction histidine kinase
MFTQLFPSLSRTYERLKKHPQLFWTIFVSIVITVSFIVVAELFISIAQDAQERLINVRIGSIQDSLSEFVVLSKESKQDVDRAIANLILANPTILDFTFYTKEQEGFKVFASSNKTKVESLVSELPLAGQMALSDSKNSYTQELQNSDQRLYQTFRSLSKDGQILGLIETTQTLSQADLMVENNIKKGLVIFIFILLLVMFLFFRHAKIIDYTTLYEELKQVDQLKDDFISMASHELKTPLTAIRGYSEYITEGKEIPEEYKEYSRRIDISSKQLATLVEDMLDVSRIQQGRMQFDIKRILVPDFIKNIFPDFEALAKEKNLKLSIEQEGLKFAYIEGDETRLRQVFINIVGNAIKYTKEGEVKIKLLNDGHVLEIRIVDSGIGMSEEERKHLFEKFYRIKNEETKDIRGTGLGLWITKQLIEKMEGTLSVESIKGTGTHMIIRFNASV